MTSPLTEVIAAANESAARRDVDDMRQLMFGDYDTYTKHFAPKYVSRCMLTWGPPGVRALEKLYEEAKGHIIRVSISAALFAAAEGKLADLLFDVSVDEGILTPQIDEETRATAHEWVRGFVRRAISDESQLGVLAGLIQDRYVRGSGAALIELIYDAATEAALAVRPDVLREFADLIERDESEESLHQFIRSNPMLLDPLAMGVTSKQQLGNEFATDFVVQSVDGSYTLVEIERPGTPIVTQDGRFAWQFTHAFGQVMDFQAWLEHNSAYARELMPGISAPKGLLVIGARTALDPAAQRKLTWWNVVHRGYVRVVCFDDLLAEGELLYANVRRTRERG